MQTQNQPLRSEFRLGILSPPDTVDDALDLLAEVWRQRPDIAPQDRMVLETIVGELVSNVIQHNPGRSIASRLSLRIEADRIRIATDDDGCDAQAALTAPDDQADPFAESGRGMALIRRLADRIEYTRSDARNHWQISCCVQPTAT